MKAVGARTGPCEGEKSDFSGIFSEQEAKATRNPRRAPTTRAARQGSIRIFA